MSIRSLYNWALRQAEQSYAPWLLFTLAMIEPCLLPIPPDTLLIPMSIARRDKAIHFATICTVGSVIGGLLGYGIGALAMATIGQWIVDTYHLQAAFEMFRNGFQKWGAWIILAKGFTPLPFILVAVASGLTHLALPVFVLSATVTRGARFFLEAFLIRKFGAPIQLFIEKYLTLIALGVLAIIVAGFYIVLHH
ncbi:MAG: DedA family protein [Alphaproteobacteria bacterium]|nr:DedA family protein [Alphaproteobacteria bacterium]MBV8548846.1 DedA family protein [Alphaproteobacteria bacterium]